MNQADAEKTMRTSPCHLAQFADLPPSSAKDSKAFPMISPKENPTPLATECSETQCVSRSPDGSGNV